MAQTTGFHCGILHADGEQREAHHQEDVGEEKEDTPNSHDEEMKRPVNDKAMQEATETWFEEWWTPPERTQQPATTQESCGWCDE
ncbi:hypothetical protein NDU88_001831 [Pleurodeles waltl]|uniref:Uncharacterized protein n=1 Tax=Pleurodeles waltl TaxID=8319 RepID=A0AAV7P5C3_PLEWA|nr:hypothetical protein NDU88_001831 [Pleurodeles waltl]